MLKMKNMDPRAVQFSAVREDPEIETAVLLRAPLAKNALIIGSGGCTAFTLAIRFPHLSMCILDPNPDQIKLIQGKTLALRNPDRVARQTLFDIGQEGGLLSGGNFEALFRGLRGFIYDFVAERSEWIGFFDGQTSPDFLDRVFASKYWPVGFTIYFSEALLVAMFGPEAVQHAPRNSYPRYFQQTIERGLKRGDAGCNYFLHHILLGHYLERAKCLPPYLDEAPPSQWSFEFKPIAIENIESFAPYDFVSLSNIFDWMDVEQTKRVARRLSAELKPGAQIVIRQLNNDRDLEPFFAGSMRFDDQLATELHASDRSLFYSKLRIAKHV